MRMFDLKISFWVWGIVAMVLFVMELLIPVTYFLWPGLAALAVGVILFMFPDLGFEWQLILFAVLALSSAILWHYRVRHLIKTGKPFTLNRRGASYVGSTITLSKTIHHGTGTINLDGVYWKIQGDTVSDTLPKGSKVKVTGLKNGILFIEELK